MNDRIKQIQLALNMSQKDFAEAIGIAPGALSNIYSGRTNATGNHVNGIHKAFPNINVNWLMFGEGDMYVDAGQSAVHDNPVSSDDQPDNDSEMVSFAGDLFAARSESPGTFVPSKRAVSDKPNYCGAAHSARHCIPGSNVQNSAVLDCQSEAKKIDIVKPKIKEIRVFYDDGTYETFVPSK